MKKQDAVFCSPSKIDDFRRYFSHYPKHPLKIDLFVDLLLYPKLILAEEAFGVLFRPNYLTNREGKRAFEDLVNLGPLKPVKFEQTQDFLEEYGLSAICGTMPEVSEAVQNLALVIVQSQESQRPLTYRADDLMRLAPAMAVLQSIRQCSISGRRSEEEPENSCSMTAKWFVSLTMPRLLAERKRYFREMWSPEGPDESIWISPSELVTLLKDKTAIAQIRNLVQELADRDASELEVSAEIAKERSTLKKRLKVADVTFDLLGLALIPAPPHFSFIAGTLAIAIQPLVSRLVSRPYRWLLHTEEIDTKLS